jgi:hypothetical protein
VASEQHTQEPGPDGRQAREPLTVRSLLNDLAIVLGITGTLASLMLPARLAILAALITSPPLLLVLRLAGHRSIAEVATDFMRAAHRLDGAVATLGEVSWRFLVASVLALAMITTQATSVIRDRLEESPAFLQASNALLVIAAHSHAISANDLAILRATASTMAHASRALADPSTQGQAPNERAKRAAIAAMSVRHAADALQAMAVRNLALLRATTSTIAHARRTLSNPSTKAHAPNEQVKLATIAAMAVRNLALLRLTTSAIAQARRALADPSTKAQALNEGAKRAGIAVRSLAMLRANASAIAHASRALAQPGPIMTLRHRAVRP